MQKFECKLTVYFEDPFWVGVFERRSNGLLEACRVVFGAEPKDYDVYMFFLENWKNLRFGASVKDCGTNNRPVNPKRLQREIKKQVQNAGIGTKAQQAIKLQQEAGKELRKKAASKRREEEKGRKYLLRQLKKQEKRNGH